MQELFPIVAPFAELLGKQPYTPDAKFQYRPSTYCVTEHLPEGMLLFSTLTKAMVLLSDNEMDSIAAGGAPLRNLVEGWFYVPAEHDDKLFSQQVRNVARMLLPPVKDITSYTIFTTTDCNARCFYCFEKNASRIPMSPEVAIKTADFIADHCGCKLVTLSWFGGEPLYNMEVIDKICCSLGKREVAFRSKMISNGYLFDKEIVRRAKEEWKLGYVQITLDGTEEVYNKTKAYIYKGVNAFRRVIENIHLLLDAEIAVDIRLNIDTYNSADLVELSRFLIDEFRGKKGFHLYIHPLFGDSMHFAVDDPARRRNLYEIIKQLQTAFEEAGVAQHSGSMRSIRTNQCMADSDASLTILPSGLLTKCEHYTDDHFVGHIDKGVEFDQNEIAAFKETRPEIEACDSCPLYPNCFLLIRCDTISICYPEQRAEWLRQTQSWMRTSYYAKIKKDSLSPETTTNDNVKC